MNLQDSRVNRRRKAVIDLNIEPRDHHEEGASTTYAIPIDVDAIEDDDDVIESSAIAFAEAKSMAARTSRRPLVVDVELGGTTRLHTNLSNKRRRVLYNQPFIDCEHVDVVEVNMSLRVSSAPPPEEPKFTCPICLCPFTEEMSTKCGHIFCKGCIKMAISRQGKCPTCRKKVTAKELIRVFLPATTR